MNKYISGLALGLGVKHATIAKWEERGQVPQKWWLPLVELGHKSGISLSSKDMVFKTKKVSRRPRAT